MRASWRYTFAITIGVAIGLVLIDRFVPDYGTKRALASAANIVFPLLALAWIGAGARRFTRRRDRLTWICLGASVLTFTVFWLLTSMRGSQFPEPGWAEILAAASFLFLWAGLLLHPGEFPRELLGRLIIAFDIVISVAAAVCITVLLSFPSLIFATGTASLTRSEGIAYPLGALITLVCINLLLVQTLPRQHNAPRSLLVLGVGFLLVGGMWSVYLALTGEESIPFLCQTLWPVGYLLFGVSAGWQAALQRPPSLRIEPQADPFPSLTGLLVPVTLVLTAMVLAMYSLVETNILQDPGRLLFTLASLAGLIAMTMVRQVITFESNRQLYRALHLLCNQLTRNAATDPLTGLANHGYFMERLDQEVQRAKRYGRSLSVIFADMDHFKRINDTYGHHAGDQALKMVARVLEGTVRDADLVARYGGEEFVVLLPETSLEQATLLAERLRILIGSIVPPFLEHDDRQLSLSCGVAALPTTSGSSDDLLCCADQAMYRAKQAGRDRVIVAPLAKPVAAPV